MSTSRPQAPSKSLQRTSLRAAADRQQRSAGMERLALIAAVVASIGCSPRGTDRGEGELAMADVAGRYGGPSHIQDLELAAGGTYECFVFNGLAGFGCGAVEGAGKSRGTWTLEGGALSFTPIAESGIGQSGLVVSFAGATAVPSEAGLVLAIEDVDYLLDRSPHLSEQPNKPKQTDAVAPRR